MQQTTAQHINTNQTLWDGINVARKDKRQQDRGLGQGKACTKTANDLKRQSIVVRDNAHLYWEIELEARHCHTLGLTEQDRGGVGGEDIERKREVGEDRVRAKEEKTWESIKWEEWWVCGCMCVCVHLFLKVRSHKDESDSLTLKEVERCRRQVHTRAYVHIRVHM